MSTSINIQYILRKEEWGDRMNGNNNETDPVSASKDIQYFFREADGGWGWWGRDERHVPREQVAQQGDTEPQDQDQSHAGQTFFLKYFFFKYLLHISISFLICFYNISVYYTFSISFPFFNFFQIFNIFFIFYFILFFPFFSISHFLKNLIKKNSV